MFPSSKTANATATCFGGLQSLGVHFADPALFLDVPKAHRAEPSRTSDLRLTSQAFTCVFYLSTREQTPAKLKSLFVQQCILSEGKSPSSVFYLLT